ncbi:PTS sugar transporter subunit IIA [Opitutus terrae]|uniref:Putative PTS IIA-like nitrogen-regulatory protein PtsN n=1 Tax=Opitutus terrae (strain DSM 11246 / JCM 15787 / PB90-1) TaxID=452637 RepID=B1ZR78_OPITP|nr:PTS sugar transporter subunit IIA [Opitutus terrae]ACB74565.1 putative PTS IIA-like nitrogen-regulatory protein PtsN [Opitutus terrae PB90-1]
MTLADLTRDRLCVPACRGRDATSVLLELSLAFAEAGVVSDSLSLYNAALNEYFLTDRDVLGSVAYPVCRLSAIEAPVFAVARSREPYTWRDGFSSVRWVFLILTPQVQSRRLSRLLAAISELAHDDAALASLALAGNRDELLERLRTVELPGGEPLTPGLAANLDPALPATRS